MYPEYSNSRAYGFPVRCVQHLQAAFSKNKVSFSPQLRVERAVFFSIRLAAILPE